MQKRTIKDRLIEFITIFATIITLLLIIGVPIRSTIIFIGLIIGLSYVIISHVTLFFLKINTDIEEIKNYIKGEDHTSGGRELKMNKKGKVNWMIIILSIVLALILIFVFKNLFNF
ncbi:MAG: hypothetical protein ABIF08_01570 [Nanoarchaeota archaeon]